MGIILKDILKMSCFENSKLVSGIEIIDRTEVEGITIVERPDIANWIKGGELLLTSFYSIESDVTAQKKLVEDVARNGAAGIIIKVSDVVPVVSNEIIETGKRLNFPVISISKEVKYIDILYPVMGLLFNEQVYKLNYYKECHEKFNRLSLEMKGFESIAKTLDGMVENPVIIFDSEMRILAFSNEQFSELNIVEKKMKKMIYEGYPIYGLDINFEEDEYHLTIEPIEVVNRIQAYLGVLEVTRDMNKMDFIALESAANTLRLEILKETAVNEAKLRYKGDLMDDLISGNYDSVQSIYDRGHILGWDLRKKYLLGLYNISWKNEEKHENNAEWSLESRNIVKTIIDRIAFHHTTGHISLIKGEELIVFWPVVENESPQTSIKNLKIFGEEVRETVKKRFGEVFVTMGIGSIAETVKDMGRSYSESKDAANFGKRIFGEDSTSVFDELGIYKMLCSFDDRDALQDFIPESLRKLNSYDKDKNNELIDTFEMYLKCNLNAVKTAEELFVHYKTVLYRLNRIKEITGLDIEDRDKMLEIEVGLKIMKIMR
ncbi:MAG TPA: PucR family transcriptional regulator ligand-binding domain-containing protein [Tissierellaceae bacterium]|nr:PucR family transcriptional regulator ligand-binding domain-containing protein [Tissierellaceae bacterium]